MGFVSIVAFAHKLVLERVKPGETVIDATVGNGVDTEFLCKTVGPKGIVFGFDIQEQALRQAEQRISRLPAQLRGEIKLVRRSHAEMEQAIPASQHGKIAAIMFNLGYLPGADQRIVTLPETTLPALQASLHLLRTGGVLTVVVYPGHEGGQAEADAVTAWAAALPQESLQVLQYRFLNPKNKPPYLIAVEKREIITASGGA